MSFSFHSVAMMLRVINVNKYFSHNKSWWQKDLKLQYNRGRRWNVILCHLCGRFYILNSCWCGWCWEESRLGFSTLQTWLTILKTMILSKTQLLANHGSFKGGQSSNFLDQAGGTSLGKLIKEAFNLGPRQPLKMKARLPFGLFKCFK